MKAFSHWLVRPLLYFSICCLGSVSVRADYIETKLQSFSPGADLIIASRSGGEIVTLSDSTGTGGLNNSLHLSNGVLSLLTEQVHVDSGRIVQVGADVRAWEADGSGFETNDRLRMVAEYSVDGAMFTAIPVFDVRGGPFDGVNPNLDLLGTLRPDGVGPYSHFSLNLPRGTTAVQLRIDANNDSPTEHFYIDNLMVMSVLEIGPEPGSSVMGGLGLFGLVGYGIRRRCAAAAKR